MQETSLTNDEKRCLQLWFRQAISSLERAEALNQLARRDRQSQNAHAGHRVSLAKRRTRRTKDSSRVHEVLA